MRLRLLLPSDLPGVEALLNDVAAQEGGEALSEEARLDLGAIGSGVVIESRGRLAGCASLRHEGGHLVIELACAPGAADEVLDRLLDGVLEQAQGHPVRLWCVDEKTLAAGLARGLQRSRTLLELECALPIERRARVPAGVEIRTFSADDIPALLDVNNAAFGGIVWTEADVAARLRRPWFDPAGVFLAWEGDRAIGVSWTKMHPGGVGEIYLLAVHPEAQGRSVGRELALTALEYLHEVGAATGLAYTNAGNQRARQVYSWLGFETVRVRECLEG